MSKTAATVFLVIVLSLLVSAVVLLLNDHPWWAALFLFAMLTLEIQES